MRVNFAAPIEFRAVMVRKTSPVGYKPILPAALKNPTFLGRIHPSMFLFSNVARLHQNAVMQACHAF